MFGIYRYQLVGGTYERVPITTTTTEHHYVTQNGKVVRETIGTGETAQVLDFIYDESGKPFALKYTNGTAEPVTYYYVLNLQGDVVKLVEHRFSGRVYNLITVAKYTYDAWGKPLSTTDGEGNSVANTHIAKLNPLRYRGYYFDMETGFYYLQSRYYDPTLRRFINADSLASTGQGILGTNMFAYCNNNPIAYRDESGEALGPTCILNNSDSTDNEDDSPIVGAHTDVMQTYTVESYDIINFVGLLTVKITASVTSYIGQRAHSGSLLEAYAFKDFDIDFTESSYGVGLQFLDSIGLEFYVMWFGIGMRGSLIIGDTEIFVNGKIDIDGYTSISIGVTKKINDAVMNNYELSINGNTRMVIALIGCLLTGQNLGQIGELQHAPV